MFEKIAPRQSEGEQRLKVQAIKFARYLEFAEVFSFEHLMEAAKDCALGVGWKKKTQAFLSRKGMNCKDLKDSLQTGRYKKRKTWKKTILERGKKREICIATYTDRVVERVLCTHFLDPILKDSLVKKNSASQEGKGCSFAREHYLRDMKSAAYHYGLGAYLVSFDIHDYFASIDTRRVYQMIRQHVEQFTVFLDSMSREELRDAFAARDKRVPAWLWKKEQSVQKSCKRLFAVLWQFLGESTGLMLGNQVSQTVAIWYLNSLDHALIEQKGLPYSGRYMDDGYVWCHNKGEAKEMPHAKEGLLLRHSRARTPKPTAPVVLNYLRTPEWWNGRHGGLKNL